MTDDLTLPPKPISDLALRVHWLLDHYRLTNADKLYDEMRAYGDARAAAAVARERERCAKVCDGQAQIMGSAAALADADDRPGMLSTAWKISLCAAAIRAGG